MINILIHDKHGKELKNGDFIKYFSFRALVSGDDWFESAHDGSIAEWMYLKIDAQAEFQSDGLFHLPINNFSKSELIEISGASQSISDEEYQECVVDYICAELNISPKDHDEFLLMINGFEIVDESEVSDA